MTKQKGLKIMVRFSKRVINNEPYLRAHIELQRAEGMSSLSHLMIDAGVRDDKIYSNNLYKDFALSCEAKLWADMSCEKIRRKYLELLTIIDSLEVPEDFETFE